MTVPNPAPDPAPPPDPKPQKLPLTMDLLEKRLAKLEEKRDQEEGLSHDEIAELRKGWKDLKKQAGKPQEASEEGFLDWLFD